jgi:hypothetical protein
MAAANQTIDRYLGNGYYKTWQDLERQKRQADNRYALLERQLGSFAGEVTNRIYWDRRLLDRVAWDCQQGMNLIAAGKAVDKAQLNGVLDVYSVALGVVELENDVLEALWAAGFVTAFVLFPFALFEYRAQQLKKVLEALQKVLETAKQEVEEVWAQGLIDTALLGVSIFLPQVGLVTKLTMAVGGYVLDEALGTDKSPTIAKLDNAGEVAGPVLDVVEGVEKMGEKTRRVAGKAGKVVAVAGVFFDADELSQAYKHVDEIKARMNAVRKTHDEYKAMIRENAQALTKLRFSLGRAARATSDARENAERVRDERARTIKDARYSTDKPVQWVLR